MTPSPLQLERHFFSKVLLEAHPDGRSDVPLEVHCQQEVGQAMETPNRFQVVLRLKFGSPKGKKTSYTGEVHAVGLFRVADKWPKDKVGQLVEANGAALLYGAIRELIINLTSRGPWPALVMNSVTFVRPKEKSAQPVRGGALISKS